MNVKRILTKNDLMKRIENQHKEEIEEILRRLFVDENKSMHVIAKELGISYVTVTRWLALSGVRSRKINLGE